jgi:hypothetical protein
MKITKSELRKIIEEVAEELGVLEGNAFGDAVRKAKENNEDEFEVDGKTFKVKEALTKKQEKLPPALKKAILKKQGESTDSVEEEEEVTEELTAKQKKTLPPGLQKAILKSQGETVDEEEETEEEKVSESTTQEGNAFGDAVRKAKENDEDEFEVDGKTYKVKEEELRDAIEETADDYYTAVPTPPLKKFGREATLAESLKRMSNPTSFINEQK